ncbi:MAG TPA: phenol hydroxylase subunit [Azoarcus taiwanensis]|uniref:Phenol hydroxylase n=2 Tax=Azoarcus taiwanensis TaxID=666964 RepID=A0A972J7M1_9RHOO|nr:phenol hydroxylase [Azoarcus taiwanensis]HRQ59134.1 phenol hydroxylase subunit [Azoarcus taiwanensis]
MSQEKTTMDLSRKFVRLVERREDGLVEFEFSIGDPELYAEMLLPADAYEDFCRINAVTVLEGEREEVEQDSGLGWSLHEANTRRY